MRFPKADTNSSTGDLAVTFVQSLFEQHGWKFRRQDGNTDFGVDAEIEMVERKFVTGKLVKLQIKGTRSIKWSKDNTCALRIRVETWNLWKSMSLPTFAILCCIPERTAYWAFPFSVAPKADAQTVTTRFHKVQCLSASLPSFETFAKAVIRDFPDPSIAMEVPGFFEMYEKKFLPDRDWSDPFCEIDAEQDFLVRLFYRHVLRLRTSVGLPTSGVFPLEWFYLRSNSIAGWTEGILFREVFSELVDYLTPLYSDALGEVKRRSEVVEVTFENEEIINFFRAHEVFEGYQEELGKHERIRVRVRDPRIDAGGRFQLDFERLLQERNVRLRVNLKNTTIG